MNKFKVYIRTLKNGKYPPRPSDFRIRIIYPDGTAEYSYAADIPHTFTEPCWYKSGRAEKESIKAMKAYDKRHGFKTKLLFKF